MEDQVDQEQGQYDPDPQEPVASSGSILGQNSFSKINLIPFIPTEGEEVPDFSTMFYDKEKKIIVKRTKKKVETREQSGKMVIDKTLVHGTNKYP